jgi:hypothetical protein
MRSDWTDAKAILVARFFSPATLLHGISRAMRALSIRLSFLVLVLAACNRDRVEKKQQPEVNKEAGGYDLQTKCASDSLAWFNEHWNQDDKQTLSLSYTHHYNNSLGKCFVIVKRRYTTNKLISFSNWSLWEIYENVQHANSTRMIEEHPQPGAPHKESLEACEVYGKRCKTSQEFDNLIRPYMND